MAAGTGTIEASKHETEAQADEGSEEVGALNRHPQVAKWVSGGIATASGGLVAKQEVKSEVKPNGGVGRGGGPQEGVRIAQVTTAVDEVDDLADDGGRRTRVRTTRWTLVKGEPGS